MQTHRVVPEDRILTDDPVAHSARRVVQAISHDIGEPLREVIGFAQLLASHAPGASADTALVTPEFWSDLEHIEAGAVRTRKMLDALCRYLGAGFDEPPARSVDVETVLSQALRSVDSGRVHRRCDLDGPLHTQAELLTDTVAELVANALRFGHPSTEPVLVEVDRLPESALRVTVTDRGPGIAADQRQRACQLFVRLHRRDQLDTVGAGLAVIDRRLHQVGGSLELDDGPDGIGLRVTATLPATAHPNPPQANGGAE